LLSSTLPRLQSCSLPVPPPFPCFQAAPIFDKVVFSKIKEKLGGRVKLVVSGAARPRLLPVAPALLESRTASTSDPGA
jgi:long-subunit acyl-CoA synthetase (AMP-forming)